MSVRFDATGDYLSKTNDLPTGEVHSLCFWAKLSVDQNTISVMFEEEWASVAIRADTNGTLLGVYDNVNGFQTNNTDLTVGTWYHIGYTRNGGGTNALYLNGALEKSLVAHNCSGTTFFLGESGESSHPQNGCIERFRMWSDAVMGATEFSAEMNSGTAVRSTNLFMNTPLVSDANDISGNGKHWTTNGSLTWESGPSFGAVSVDAVPSLGSGNLFLPTAEVIYVGSIKVSVTL